jgi:hypothetical protein
MEPEPRPVLDLSLRAYLGRFALLAVVIEALFLALPAGQTLWTVPSAGLARWLASSTGAAVNGHGAQLLVMDWGGGLVSAPWTAAPVFALAAAGILAYPTDLGHKLQGLVQVLFHTFTFNVMVLTLVAMQPTVMPGSAGPAPRVPWCTLYSAKLAAVYAPLMTLVMVLSLLFWMLRVVPRPLWGRPKVRRADG